MKTQKKNYNTPEMEVNEVKTDIILSSINDMTPSTDDDGYGDWLIG